MRVKRPAAGFKPIGDGGGQGGHSPKVTRERRWSRAIVSDGVVLRTITHNRLSVLVYDIFFGHEHIAPCAVDKFWRHLIGNAFVITNRDHLVDQENRLIVRIDVVDLGVTVVQQVNQRGLIEGHFLFARNSGYECVARAGSCAYFRGKRRPDLGDQWGRGAGAYAIDACDRRAVWCD